MNVSGYVCNHGSPSGVRDTASPRGRYGERRQRDPCLKYTYIKTPLVGWRQPMTSLPARPQYKGRRENTSFASLSEACVRSMAHSMAHSGNHGSPSWEPRTASPRGRYGERYTHTTMLRGVQANFAQNASTMPTLPG